MFRYTAIATGLLLAFIGLPFVPVTSALSNTLPQAGQVYCRDASDLSVSCEVAGSLDSYYLKAFGRQSGSALEQESMYEATATVASPHCGTPLKHGLSRDWDRLQPDTQKLLAKELALPLLSGPPQTAISSGGHFRIHYTTSGTDAPNVTRINQYTGLGLSSTAAWVAQVGEAFESAYLYYQSLGYHMPPTNPYDVYMRNLAYEAEYGATIDIQKAPTPSYPYASSSYIEIDKDFTSNLFNPQTYSPLQSLQVTSAHEFHHAIQYGYNYYFDIWYAEATSTWFEDEVYDDVNQLYSYLPTWFAASTAALDAGDGYDRWILNRYLNEKYGMGVVKNFFETLAGIAPTGGQDIPMAPVLDSVLSASYNSSLGTDLLGFAKRVYTRDWATHISDISRVPYYSPISYFSTYPVGATTLTLPHYSFGYYRFSSSAGAPDTLNLTVNGSSGIRAIAIRKSSGANTEFIFDNMNNSTVAIPGFSSSDEVVLAIVNTSFNDGESAVISATGSYVSYFTVTPSATFGGVISPNTAQTLTGGDTATFTIIPNVNYTATVSGCDGTPQTGDTVITYTTGIITADCTVSASFNLITPAQKNGSCGSSNGGIFTATPEADICNYTSITPILTGTGPWYWTCSGSDGGTSASCSANSALTSPISKAKVFLGAGDDIFTASSNGMTIYGNNGTDTVTISANTSGITLDQNIEQINLVNASSGYTFKQSGNTINVYDPTGTTLLVKAPIQDDTNGTILSFSDGTASAIMGAGGVMMLGGVTISSSTATMLSPVLR